MQILSLSRLLHIAIGWSKAGRRQYSFVANWKRVLARHNHFGPSRQLYTSGYL